MVPQEVIEKHQKFLWTRFVMLTVGIWLIVTPITFYQYSPLTTTNDVLCGAAAIIISLMAVSAERLWAPWALCGIGVWLQLAPLVLWAPSAVAYLNNTASGALFVLLSVIIPGTPGGIERLGSEIPAGWSYNPSSWPQRIPIIILAFLAWMSARYMAAYQLGYIDTMWDPIFKNGTLNVITSWVSKDFPISDAGLGAFVYTMEVLMGFKGSTRRWYTMPWIVFLFGIMVVPAGLASIILIMLQPILVGYWCTWCLFTAVCMLVMIALTVDEVVAVCQYLAFVKAKGMPFWEIFWKGGDYLDGKIDTRTPALDSAFGKTYDASTWGLTVPWNLVAMILTGGVLMFSTNILGESRSSAVNDHITGALIATIAFISMAEVIRAVRFLNTLLGIWVILSAFFFTELYTLPFFYHILMGCLVAGLSFPRGKIKEKYGAWNRYVF